MSHLTMSMQRLGLRSPKKVRASNDGRARLQPPKLDLGEDTLSRGPSRDQSRNTDLGHGRVSHNKEGVIHFTEVVDSKEPPPKKKQQQADPVQSAVSSGAQKVMQQNEANWNYLSQLEQSADAFGVPAERVWFCGRICGYGPGERQGLPAGFCPRRGVDAYYIALDTAEKALTHVLGPFSQCFEAKVGEGGLAEGKRLRGEWSAMLNDLIAETRPGQLGELYRRTERVFREVEEAAIEGYQAPRQSLDEAVHQSEAELDEKAALRKKRSKKEPKARGSTVGAVPPPRLSDEERGGGPLPKTTKSSGREANLPPKFEKRRDEVSGEESERTRWRKREEEIYARIEGLMAASAALRLPPLDVQGAGREGEFAGTGARPKTHSQEALLPHRRDTSTPRGTTSFSRLSEEPTGYTNPVVRRYMQSPFVTAAAEFEEEMKEAEAKRVAARAKAKARRQAKGKGYQLDSSTSGEEEELQIPTTVRFRDRIKNFPKFNRPDGVQTWTDFLQQLVELLRLYRIPAREWPAWLIDRLAGKAQSALLNLTTDQRGNWAELVSALNSHFHVEFEMRAAEEELLSRKQGPKESVREFISQLRFLARKAYGQDLERREAAVIKRLELGLASASLRRTFDDMYGQPGVTFAVLTGELIRRESRDEPARYQQFVTKEREEENSK